MPSRIFGIELNPRSSPQLEAALALTSRKSISGAIEPKKPTMDHIRRPSLNLMTKRHSSAERKGSRSSSKDKNVKETLGSPLRPKPVKLQLIMESPPVLMLDAPEQSSGALISGRLQVTPNSSETVINAITMYLECTTSTKKPVHDRCRECSSQIKDLFEWNFLTKPKTFRVLDGTQELPFSHLIPGHLPSTTHGHIGSIDYSLHVRARSSDGQETEFRRELIVQRALRPGNDKNSMRVFPPTDLTLHVTLPNIVHPIGSFPITFRMTGITTKRDDTLLRWRLRKLIWRIEEHEVNISPACAAHAHKVGGDGKGVQHEHTREIGGNELKSGWKTDFSDGTFEGEFQATMDGTARPQCGVEAQNGLKIEHNLVLELVISEEWLAIKKPAQATPTGAARVLRTHFKLLVTERAGLGIAWDDEQPPMYEDVPASPPHYGNERTQVEDYEGDDLHEDVEQLTLNP